MGYVRHGHELSEILLRRVLADALVEDQSADETYAIFLLDIGGRDTWSPNFAERVAAIVQNSPRRLLENFRFYVCWLDGNRFGYIHANTLRLAAGMYDTMAVQNRAAGAIDGYRVTEDRDFFPAEAGVA
jgi:hypothetical protein